jgi:hypothetical protein
MLTFKATLHDTQVAFDQAVDRRETIIHQLLAEFLERGARGANLLVALNNLSTAQADFDAFEQELLRLDRIERITNEIGNPFPPHIAKKLRAIGIDDEAQRELANEMLADANGGPEAVRALHENAPAEMPDAPWMTADIGGSTVEYAPGTGKSKVPLTPMERGILMHKILEGKFDDDPVGRARAMHEIIEDVGNSSLADLLYYDDGEPWPAVDERPAMYGLLDDDDRPSLHGDGHVGPVEQHLRKCAALDADDPYVHDVLEGGVEFLRQRRSKTDTLLDDMRREVERATNNNRRRT